ncbi:MAG: hypothetical protein ACI97A_000322 [Planctomycetota bacterium]|jgi:hypothetical protein
MDQNNPQEFRDSEAKMRETFSVMHGAVVELRNVARVGCQLSDAVVLWEKALLASKGLEGFHPKGEDGACLDQLALGLEELESSAREFFRDTDADDAETARRCAVLRAVARLLLRLTRGLEEKEARDETPFLIQELRDIDNGLDGEEEVDTGAAEDILYDNETIRAAKIEIMSLRAEVLKAQAEHQLEAAKQIQECELSDAYRVFRLSRSLSSASFHLELGIENAHEGARESLSTVAQELRCESERLRDLFVLFMKTTEDKDGLDIAVEASRWVTGEIDQARMDSYEDRTIGQVKVLQCLETDGKNFVTGMKAVAKRIRSLPADEVGEENAKAGKRADRKLRRMVRRMGSVIADRILSLRLDRTFGPRQVKRWEKMIFWLIMVVMLLIVIDHFSGPSITEEEVAQAEVVEQQSEDQGEEDWEEIGKGIWSTIGWTVWVDTLICLILLWDFMIRLLLSPSRLAYFRRNFITEFLPSLPFGLLQGLMAVDKLRFIRTARLVRVARVLRVLRPIIRLSRLFLFLARAADRLVERNSWFLNQNIVFATEDEQAESNLTLLSRARNIDSWIAGRTSNVLKGLPVEAQIVGAEWRMGLIEAEFSCHDGGVAAASVKRKHGEERIRDLDVDSVVDNLRGLDDNQVAEIVGVDVARQLTASLSFFRLPFLRHFAFSRFLLGPSGAPDPLWTTARLGRLSGDLLAWVARGIHWFADLYGTITGAQFLDRVGIQLVKATIRPAKRLVIFVVVISVILGMAWLTQVPAFIKGVDSLRDALKFPIIVLGVVCFIPLALGLWLRRIAGQAVDFFDRVSEAQFFALTETAKEVHGDRDVSYLVERVLMPEHKLLVPEEAVAEREVARSALFAVCQKQDNINDEASPLPWSMCDAMMLYYRDFIDGAYFHKNDTKIANILVGNLTLENIRRNRLQFDAKRFKRLDRLDIARDKGGISGPRVWFNFITHSVAQHTARLIIEYNQHCIPVDEYNAADAEDRRIFDAWLARRERISLARRRNEVLTTDESQTTDSSGGTLVYRTTEFNALNFLTKEEKRDNAIRSRFGDDVANLLLEDRENLIRDIFGTFPMHELAKSKRTINPYRFYRKYLARGRVFAFPLILVWLVLCGVRLLIKRIVLIVKDVLNPNDRPLKVSAGRSGFEVARRKIHRMRRPVVMETVRLRALFDVEYLGIAIPGITEDSIRPEDLLVEDLRRLDASERDWQNFREIKTKREQQIRVLSRFLRDQAEAGHQIADDIVARNENLVGREGQAMRVVATAFACDHLGSYSILSAIAELRDVIHRLPKEETRWQRFRLSKKTLAKVEKYWEFIADPETNESMLRILAASLDHGHKVARKHLANLDELLPEGVDPIEHVYGILLEAGERPSSWSEQMIAVRTVQSLGMLDLEGYEQIIRDLGGYTDDESVESKSKVRRHL